VDKLAKMKDRKAEIYKRLEAIYGPAEAEDRDLTAEELTEYEQLKAEDKQLDARIAQAEDMAKRRQWADTPAPEPDRPERAGLEIADDAIIRVALPRYRKLRAFVGPTEQRAEEDAYIAGQALLALLGRGEPIATRFPDVARKAALADQWCRDHGIDIRAQSGGTIGGGGATVPTEFSNRVINLQEEFGVARRECYIQPMTSDSMIVPRRTSGPTVYCVGDTTATTESTMGWDNVELVAREWSALTVVPISLMEDSVINWADTLAYEFAQALATKEDDCLFNGDGTKTYGGVVGIRTKMIDGNHAGSYEDATTGDDQWGEYVVTDLELLPGKVPAYPGLNEKWYCSKIAWAQTLIRLAVAQGGSSGLELTRGLPKMFLGYDVVISQKMPTATTALDAVVVFLFGDMSKAVTFGTRGGLRVAQSEHRYFEYRQIGIVGSERIAIVVHDVGDASNAGPLVGLRGNTS
jgi:HK97 family phage major capsid protein